MNKISGKLFDTRSALMVSAGKPGFGTLVFSDRETNNSYLQRANGTEKIDSFVEFRVPEGAIDLDVEEIVSAQVGDDLLYSFFDQYGSCYVGSRQKLSSIVASKVDDLQRFPFLIRSIGMFAERPDIIGLAASLISGSKIVQPVQKKRGNFGKKSRKLSAIQLPQDVFELSDHHVRPWPTAWTYSFWRHKFFYVAGFKQYLEDLGIVDNQPRLNAMFSGFKDTACDWIGGTWLAQLYGVQEVDLEVDETKEKQHLKVLIMGRLLDAARSAPVSFSQALLTTVALAGRMELDGDKRNISDVVQIRCAAHYLPDFGEIYRSMSDNEKIALRTETAQVVPRLFEDVAAGYPITFDLASRVSEFVVGNTEIGKHLGSLPISTYGSRSEIKRLTTREVSSKAGGGSMRVAQPEITFHSSK